MNFFRKQLIYFIERCGLASYYRSRVYDVTYTVRIKNISTEQQRGFLVLPLPVNRLQQQLKSVIVFTPTSVSSKQDMIFGNTYVYWPIQLNDHTAQEYTVKFQVRIQPTQVDFKSEQLGRVYDTTTADYVSFTQSNKYICAQDVAICRLADEIVGQEKNTFTIIAKFNNYIVTHLQYGNPIQGLYSASDAITRKIVDCGGYATLLVALCIAKNIPARIVSGFWVGYKDNDMHAWVEILLPNGQWLPADPAVEQLWLAGRTKKRGQLGFVGSDRIIFSVGCNIPLDIDSKKVFTDILQNPLVFTETARSSIKFSRTVTTKIIV